MSKVFRTMIVTAQIAPTARTLAAALPAGLGMFMAAYSPTGEAPATHYVSEGAIEEQFAVALSSPEALVEMLAAAGQAMPLAAAQGLLSQAVVSERPASEVFGRDGPAAGGWRRRMKLALRHDLAAGAGVVHRASAAVIQARLVTRYAHAGVVVGDALIHSTGTGGVHRIPNADLAGYVLIDLGDELDAAALQRFITVAGAGYDFVSLTAFVVVSARDSKRWYCYELAYYLMTGLNPRERVTPDTLILVAMQLGGRLITPLPAFDAALMEIEHAAV